MRLFIHTDSNVFDRMPADGHHVCQQQYGMPNEIVLQLSHKDVNLGFFKMRKIRYLHSEQGRLCVCQQLSL